MRYHRELSSQHTQNYGGPSRNRGFHYGSEGMSRWYDMRADINSQYGKKNDTDGFPSVDDLAKDLEGIATLQPRDIIARLTHIRRSVIQSIDKKPSICNAKTRTAQKELLLTRILVAINEMNKRATQSSDHRLRSQYKDCLDELTVLFIRC